MLALLQTIHAELRAAIAALEAETAQPALHAENLSAARLRLSRVSGRRRALLDCTIYPHLHDASADDTRRIADLRIDAAAMQIQSSEHIGRWTMRAIGEDWPGYRRASTALRAAMLQRIVRESAILYPLLMAKAA